MHARVREFHEAGRGSREAAATNGAHAFRFRRFGYVGTGESPGRIFPNDCVSGLVAGGRHEIKADPQVSAAGGNARLAGQVIYSSSAVRAPTVQAGGLQHAADMGEGAAARISGVVHIWLGGGRSRQPVAGGGEEGTPIGVIREEIRDGTDLYPHLLGVKGPVQMKWPANAKLGNRTGQLGAKGQTES
ncbi:hypothetical protein AK812_SmicGene39588 [Symbiodinium microadriaticum]|uniref:Uncharacterized protein n=1 Tax=Symbiodinium microadriaticum TaxID=2951 RepID=A0A1Q9CAU3_SYMMI|nr:hypothetical protein AK812_SmicGene39588 [Symbiodinium microadriaticum]